MRPWNASWAILLVAGLGLMAAGCGGSRHSDEEAPAASGSEAAAPEETAGGTEVATAESATPEPAAPKSRPTAGDSAPAPAARTGSALSAAAKTEDPSATNEILQVSLVVAATPAATPANPTAAVAGTSSGSAATEAMAAAYANPSQPGSSGSSGTDSTAPGAPLVADSQVGLYSGASGAAGSGSGAGSGPGADKPGDFTNGMTGVTSFLNALKAKNIDGLAEAVALHASTDAAVPANQKLFRSILDTSISDEELDNLAAELDGFQIITDIPSTSTGMMGVLLGKFVPSQRGIQGSGTRITRTITMRREQAGWKVQDIGPARTSAIGPQIKGGRRR
jgi:hypothetical protein